MKTVLTLSIGLACVGLYACTALAQEQRFYKGTQWEVVLVNDHATTGRLPFCGIRTTTWTAKQLAFEATLRGIDDIRFALRVRNDAWRLPVGKSTKLLLSPFGLEASAVAENELYSDFTSEGMRGDPSTVADLVRIIFNPKRPAFFDLEFQGNEPPWRIRHVQRFDAQEIMTAYNYCTLSLNELGPSIFGSAETTSTSPFAAAPEGEAQSDFAVKVKRSSGLSMEEFNATSKVTIPQNWAFSVREEDWGGTCVLETEKDDLSIGFMAAPGGDLAAFIDGLGLETAVARWRANTLDAYEVEGSLNDSLGWLGFYLGSTDLISELAAAEVLMVSVVGKSAHVLDVTGSRNAFEKFMACHANDEHGSQAQPE